MIRNRMFYTRKKVSQDSENNWLPASGRWILCFVGEHTWQLCQNQTKRWVNIYWFPIKNVFQLFFKENWNWEWLGYGFYVPCREYSTFEDWCNSVYRYTGSIFEKPRRIPIELGILKHFFLIFLLLISPKPSCVVHSLCFPFPLSLSDKSNEGFHKKD